MEKKHFVELVTSLVTVLLKNDIVFMDLLFIFKNHIILSLFKIETLNFTMYSLTILTCPLKHMSLDYIS